jgi:hypothetical protein
LAIGEGGNFLVIDRAEPEGEAHPEVDCEEVVFAPADAPTDAVDDTDAPGIWVIAASLTGPAQPPDTRSG